MGNNPVFRAQFCPLLPQLVASTFCHKTLQIIITCPQRRQHWPSRELQGDEPFLALIVSLSFWRNLEFLEGAMLDARGH